MKMIYRTLVVGMVGFVLFFTQCQRSFDTVTPDSNSHVRFQFNFKQDQSQNVVTSDNGQKFTGRIYIEVTGPNMNKINRTVNISGDQITVNMTIPQGDNRRFVIYARDNKDVTWFKADTTVNLRKPKINFSIEMNPSFRLVLYKVDDNTPDAGYWFESEDTLMLNYFYSPSPINKLLFISIFDLADNQQNGNYRLVVTDTNGTILWRSIPVDYIDMGKWIDWHIVDDVRVPQNFLVGIQYTQGSSYPRIGLDMTTVSGQSVVYIISSDDFYQIDFGNWMIRAVVATPTETQKVLSPQPFPGFKNLKTLPLKSEK